MQLQNGAGIRQRYRIDSERLCHHQGRHRQVECRAWPDSEETEARAGEGSNEPRLSGDVIGMMVTDHIRSLYKHVNPAKPNDDLDKLLAKYLGSEYVMYQAACEKYGETPDSVQKIIRIRRIPLQSLAEQQPVIHDPYMVHDPVITIEDDTPETFGGVSVIFRPLEAPSHKLNSLFAGDKKRNFIT